MVDVGIWVKNADIQARAGINANTTAKAVASTDVYVLGVENYINCYLKVKITAAVYAALDADTKYLLVDAGACLCAMYVISQDMSSFSDQLEAQTMLDFLRDRAMQDLAILKEDTTKTFIGLVS
jgi:hypothetical protein